MVTWKPKTLPENIIRLKFPFGRNFCALEILHKCSAEKKFPDILPKHRVTTTSVHEKNLRSWAWSITCLLVESVGINTMTAVLLVLVSSLVFHEKSFTDKGVINVTGVESCYIWTVIWSVETSELLPFWFWMLSAEWLCILLAHLQRQLTGYFCSSTVGHCMTTAVVNSKLNMTPHIVLQQWPYDLRQRK